MNDTWGIDLGGTKIEGAVLSDRKDGSVLARRRLPTQQEKGYHHIIGRIGELVDQLRQDTGLQPAAIGIGTPGARDPRSGLMKNCNTTCLNGQPLLKDLQDYLGLPVFMANDANCFAVAEATLGAVPQAVPDARVVFGVIMGTGVGGGVVVDGRVLNGRHGIAGEWGHNFLDESGGPCYCGRSGCVETVISGPALERFYHRISGRQLPLVNIVERYRHGTDPFATQTMDRLLHFFGKAVACLINILDPDAIVLGGGLGNIDLLYTEGVKQVGRYIFNDRLNTVFLKPVLGDSAGVFGAALLVPPDLSRPVK